MSSDPSDPMNQTGSGLPVFGKIKKLGESEEATPEENFIPQEEYYDPNDFQEPASPYPAEQQAPVQYQEQPVPPPQAPSPLRLQQPHQHSPSHVAPPPQVPHQISGDEDEASRLRNRTQAHLEYKERANKTMAQFDDYFEQEMKSEPGFIETYFKMGETFSPKTRKIIAGIAGACIIFGIVISLQSFWLNLVFSLISFQAALVLSLQKGTLTKLGLFPGRIILAAVFSLLFIFVPLSYKWWQEQGGQYIEDFQHVENLANDGQKALKDAVKKAEEKAGAGDYIDSEAIATKDFKYAAGMANDFHSATYLSGGGLFKMYLQYVFLLFGFTMLPFIQERNLLKVLYLRPDNTKAHWIVSRYFMARLIKSVLISIIFAIGLSMAGCENVMFIAGTTFLLTCLSRFGPVVGLIMCIPVIVTQFRTGDGGMTALIGLAITGLLALMVESKIHWLMMVLPLKDKGILPPAITKPKQQVVKVEGNNSALISGFISLAFTLAFYGAVGFLGWKVYGIWKDHSEIQKDLPRQVKKALGESKSSALNKLEKYAEDNPYDRGMLLSLTKAYTRAGLVKKALEAAVSFRDFKAPEPDAEGLMEKGEQYVIRFLSQSNAKVNDKAALRWLLDNFVELHATRMASDELLDIINEMHETDPDEQRAYEVAGYHYMAKRDYDKVREWCAKGLAKDKENVELLKLIVKTHIEENDKTKALKALMNVDKVTTSDPEVDELNKKVRALD